MQNDEALMGEGRQLPGCQVGALNKMLQRDEDEA